MKKVPFALRKNQVFNFFRQPKKISLFFRKKYFVLHLRLCLRQKCTDIFLGIKEIVVYKKSFLKMSQNLQKKTEKNSKTRPKNSRSKSAKIRTTSCSCFLDQMAFVQYSVSTSHQNGKKYHLYSGKSFFSVFSLNFPAKKNIRHCRKIRHAQLNPWAPIYTW